MENHDNQVARWVDERLAALDAGGWVPDTARALTRFRALDRTAAIRRLRWIWAASTAAAAFVAVLVLFTPRACATPRPCANNLWQSMFAAHPPPTPQHAAPAPANNFKESGSPNAPLTCEIYSDYECPHCAVFHREILPLLVEQYVKTGQVRLIQRDMPLSVHPNARQAARYANASGRLGYFAAASDRIFLTQDLWHGNGDIDGELAKVLPQAVMEKVREMVKADPSLDESIDADVAQAALDRLNQTPSLVVVWKGRRQLIGGGLPFSLLKSYLDERLKP